jgi:2-polyprenyl-3-methyl-5-hydroxy-6-metoxy-1,4-benzoquinol methylase
VYWLTRKHIFRKPEESCKDVQDDHIAPFDEYAPCPVCDAEDFSNRFKIHEGVYVTECGRCGLLQTRPRIKESTWVEWLMQDTERSRRYTENRLKYGYACDEMVKYSTVFWHLRIRWKYKKMFRHIERLAGRSISRLHDVGCGVGFLIREALHMKIKATGNDLNGYAVKIMQERFGLEVACGTVESAESQKIMRGADLVTMTDYIEHSYRPNRDLRTVYEHLAPGRLVYLTTFHVDCIQAEESGQEWNMYLWNHVYHFDRKNLEALVEKAGFSIIHSKFPYSRPHCEILAKK